MIIRLKSVMFEKFGGYLLQNRLQKWYITNIIGKRNDYSNEAFLTPIKTYFPNYSESTTPLDLVYHGLNPLYATAQILLDTSLKFDDVKIKRLSDLPPNDQVPKIYEITLEEIERGLQKWDIDNVEGELKEIRGNEEEFKRRIGIVTMHALNHIAQAIRFQGLICTELSIAD